METKEEPKTSLETAVDEEYTVRDVLRHPLTPAWKEIMKDLDFTSLFSGGKLKKALKNDLSTLLAFGAIVGPHELIHAGVNSATGGVNKEIVINKLFGGDLYHLINSRIDADWLIPLFGGYVKIGEYSSKLAEAGVSLAPYALTPIGIYLMSKGKEKKSLPYAISGAGLIAVHAGGVIGDFFHLGRLMMYETADFIAHTVGYQSFDADDSWATIPLAAGGFYAGYKALSFTYRLCKAGVNYCRKKFKKTKK